jgi:hypothetical protein
MHSLFSVVQIGHISCRYPTSIETYLRLKHLRINLETFFQTWRYNKYFFGKVVILNLGVTLKAVGKRKISCPCREWNHDFFVFQPAACSLPCGQNLGLT